MSRNPETIAVIVLLGLYFLAMLTVFVTLITGGQGSDRLSRRLIFTGSVLHFLVIIWRWAATGHMPGDNVYELNLVGSWFCVFCFLCFRRRYPEVSSLAIFVLGAAAAMLLYGLSRPHILGPLRDEYQSPWFYIHIISAFLAYASYVVATAAALMLISTGSNENRDKGWRGRLPDAPLLAEVNGRFVAYGFACQAVMLASGSMWAHSAWGAYWNWDPVETWSLVTWLMFAFHLHAKTFLGWQPRSLAFLTVIALVAIIFTFWGLSHLPDGPVGR